MAQIALTLADMPDGKVDIQIFVSDVVEGAPFTTAQELMKLMLNAAANEADSMLVIDESTAH